MTAVHQFVPTYVPRSAIGAHTLEVSRLLRGLGLHSNTYVGEARDTEDRHVLDYRSFAPRPGEPTWLLYQLSTGHPMAELLESRPEPLIVNYHNLTPESFFGPWEPHIGVEVRTGRQQMHRLAPRSRLGIAVSAFNERELTSAGYAPTTVAPFLGDYERLGAEEDAAHSAELARARQAGGTDLLFVGRLAPHKAQHRLVQVLATYRRLYDDRARLWLVGGSSSHRYETTLRSYITALGLDGAVHLTGSVSQPRLVSHYRNADVFVSASDHEGFGVPLIEAMWHGLPVVALGTSAVGETVEDAGLVLPARRPYPMAATAAAIDRVTTDPALRAELVARGRARVDHYAIERSRKALETAITSLLDAP